MSDEKKSNPMAANIADDVIAQALQSVERHGKSNEITVEPEAAAPAAAEAVEPPAEADAAPAEPGDEPGDESAAETSAAPAAAEPAAAARPAVEPAEVRKLTEEIRKLKADLLEARQALRQREAELEASQAMSRKTMEKLRDEHERLLRASADLENYKKRTARERDDANKFGQEKLLREVLPVVDNLDRALEHAHSAADFDGLKTGIEMTRKLCDSTLAKFGAKGFSSLGEPFDPNLHEAMQAVESDQPANTVVTEMVRGYMLHDRLMRPAMVVVAKARPAAQPAAQPVDAPEAAVDEPAAEAPADEPAAEASAPQPAAETPAVAEPSDAPVEGEEGN